MSPVVVDPADVGFERRCLGDGGIGKLEPFTIVDEDVREALTVGLVVNDSVVSQARSSPLVRGNKIAIIPQPYHPFRLERVTFELDFVNQVPLCRAAQFDEL